MGAVAEDWQRWQLQRCDIYVGLNWKIAGLAEFVSDRVCFKELEGWGEDM